MPREDTYPTIHLHFIQSLNTPCELAQSYYTQKWYFQQFRWRYFCNNCV